MTIIVNRVILIQNRRLKEFSVHGYNLKKDDYEYRNLDSCPILTDVHTEKMQKAGISVEQSLTEQENEFIETYRRLYPAFQAELLSLTKSLYDVQCCADLTLQSPKMIAWLKKGGDVENVPDPSPDAQ